MLITAYFVIHEGLFLQDTERTWGISLRLAHCFAYLFNTLKFNVRWSFKAFQYERPCISWRVLLQSLLAFRILLRRLIVTPPLVCLFVCLFNTKCISKLRTVTASDCNKSKSASSWENWEGKHVFTFIGVLAKPPNWMF